MEAAMFGIKKVIVYIDNLLIHTASHDKHLLVLDSVLERLCQHGLKLNLEKCGFGNQEVSYLGFTLTPNGISPGKDKIQAIREAKAPADIKMVCSFIGLCNFFCTHIYKNFCYQRTFDKTNMWRFPLQGWSFTTWYYGGFSNFKIVPHFYPVVAFPRSDRQYALIVDASTGPASVEGGMGAILAQVDSQGAFHVISYGSCQLVNYEKITPPTY